MCVGGGLSSGGGGGVVVVVVDHFKGEKGKPHQYSLNNSIDIFLSSFFLFTSSILCHTPNFFNKQTQARQLIHTIQDHLELLV